MQQSRLFLSPTEAARRLRVSTKALRLYEHHGLVKPLRSAKGWRAYGPEEMVRLHQILALKVMGLSLARIAELFAQGKVALASVLAVQEDVLTRESERTTHALALIRSARARLAHGETLSIDDLATLTAETTIGAKPSDDDIRQIFDPLIRKHFSSDARAELAQRSFDQDDVSRQWSSLFDEARELMATGDPASLAALDLARRWKAMVEQFTQGDPMLEQGARRVWGDAMAGKSAAAMLPATPEMFAFMGKAMAKLAAGK
ncbi:MAG: MerR family transcriptional regulator [Rhizomicrobium sp.]|jgi:DNA-binding transcriptional MerR regulator